MYLNEMALRNVLGVIPTYMRPPYLECSVTCQSILGDLGYHVISTNLDTLDWQYATFDTIQTSKNIFSQATTTNHQPGPIVLSHDVHQTTVEALAEHMIVTARAAGYTLVTVGECLGDPKENWYRAAGATTCAGGGGGSAPPPVSTTTSAAPSGPTGGGSGGLPKTPDGTCGPQAGFTCQGSSSGNCCSQWGWCGSTSDYCAAGCQSGFGTCG